MSEEKKILRKGCWRAIRDAGAARFPGVEGRIPNFVGAEAAAALAATLPVFTRARTIKSNPDSPQRPLRAAALRAGKTLYLAVPRLRESSCFIELDPALIGEKNLWRASSIKGAFELGKPVKPADMPRIDLIVTGCVGAGMDGVRLGKGGGYADLEYAILRRSGKIDADVPIVSTVHPSQVLESGMIPASPWDLRRIQRHYRC